MQEIICATLPVVHVKEYLFLLFQLVIAVMNLMENLIQFMAAIAMSVIRNKIVRSKLNIVHNNYYNINFITL